MAVTSSTALEIAIGVVSTAIALFAFVSATHANREQAKSATAKVDADAYGRAKMIYESAIRTLEDQTKQLHRDIAALQTEVSTLRAQALELSAEIARLRITNQELQAQLSTLQTRREQ